MMTEVLGRKNLDIAKYLADFSAATAEQICRDIFKNGHITFVYRKMQHMERKGFVERVYFPTKRRAKGAYVLTLKGFRDCFRQRGIKPSTEKFRPGSLTHDVELVDIAYIFKRFGVASYRTENQMQVNPEELRDVDLWHVDSLRPDALLELETQKGGDFFALEYEASLKYANAIKSKLNRYYECNELRGVFYICKTKQILDAIKAVDKKHFAKRSPRIFYMMSEDFKNSKNVLSFPDRNGANLIIEELVE